MKVYLLYHVILGRMDLVKVVDSEEKAVSWVSRNPQFLTFVEKDLE